MAAESIAERARRKRWELKAHAARANAEAAYAEFAAADGFRWLDFDDSAALRRMAEALGADPSRVIQRWEDPADLVLFADRFTDASETCNLLLSDYPDAGWSEVGCAAALRSLLARVGGMSDGFILYDPATSSVFSADVEDRGSAKRVETTLIGSGFAAVRAALGEGPPALPIIPQTPETRPN